MDEIIYKYLPIERITYLQDELLRVTQPGDLNDPYEGLPVLPTLDETKDLLNRIVKERVEAFKGNEKQKEKFKKKLVKEFQKNFNDMKNNVPNNQKERYFIENMERVNKTFGLISFSRRWNSSLMWSHYTKSHRGFCVGFNSQDPFFQDYIFSKNKSRVFDTVYYSDERIKVPVTRGDITDPKIIFTKSTDWEYENEMRLLVPLIETNERIISEPFDIYLLKIPHSLIKEVIIGTNIDSQTKQLVVDFCVKNSIPLYRSKVSETKFNMEKELM